MSTGSPTPAIYKDADPDDLMIPRHEEGRQLLKSQNSQLPR